MHNRELTSREASNLMGERLIRLDRVGWALTRKGEEMLNLLNAYGDPTRQSEILEPHARNSRSRKKTDVSTSGSISQT